MEQGVTGFLETTPARFSVGLLFSKRRLEVRLRQTESHNRVPADASRLFQVFEQLCFQTVRVGLHLTRGSFFIAGAVVTQFTHAQSTFRAGTDRRAESPAGHGARGAELPH